ncbi:MAG TPA: hypothetical protein VN828_03715 [Acidobacteriaceae bacterium]|nr:hypothetical protein [Acidobacteriaceae bacterium]
MITGNINGFNLVAMPSSPGQRQVDWEGTNLVGELTNGFTGQQQIQNWNAGWLAATVTMPPLQRADAANWVAFLLQLQGPSGVFMFGDGLATQPLGTAQGMGVTVGINQGPNSFTTNGWTPSQTNLLLPGDYIQVGYRLYRNMNMVSSDTGGNASISIWPPMRENPAAGTPIVTASPQGLFRLADNTQRWSESYLRTTGISFKVREAI